MQPFGNSGIKYAATDDVEQVALARIFRASMLWVPERRMSSAWVEHVPFAFWLVDVLRPRRIVELGTLNGVSYSALCQAVKTLQLATSCFAVDTWKGDEHTGFYGEEVYREFAVFHDLHYGAFSQLVRSSFDEALGHFEDGSIDLLHIDGLHTYDAVRCDYESWLPKLAANAIVLFHDINVREKDFGVFRLWNEITPGRPHFSFLHGHGLGVLGHGQDYPGPVRALFGVGEDSRLASSIRKAFATLGRSVRVLSEMPFLEESLSTRANEIGSLRESLAAQGHELENLKEALRATIEQKERELSERDGELANLKETLRTTIDQKERESSERERLSDENAKLRIFAREQERQKQAILASTIWRLTAPLRHVVERSTPAQRHVVRRCLRAGWWAITPWRIPARLRFIRDRKATAPAIAPSVDQAPRRWETIRPSRAIPAVPGSANSFGYQPLVSVIMPVFNVQAKWLRRAISSVRAQTYANWEICVCDDGSTARETIEALRGLESAEPRLRVTRLATNRGISFASNEALNLASGEFVALLDNDDELTPHALETCVAVLNDNPRLDVIYSDEDKLSLDGRREEPFFKPDWSPSLLREVMYIGHLLVIRRSLVDKVGRFDPTYDGVQDYELMLRLAEHTNATHHVRDILYHWRRIPGSVAERTEAKPNLGIKQIAAVNAHLSRMGIAAQARAHPSLAHRAVIVPRPREKFPRVSIIIPTRDAPELISRCLQTVFDKTTYPNFEVVVVDNGTSDVDALATLDRYAVARVPFDGPFNYSRANNIGVKAASGDVLVFLNNDTEILDGDWLEQMLFLLDDPEVGAVGPLLLYPNRKVQHAGVALGIRGTADHVLRGLPEDADGYFGSLACTREVSAVTFACAMVRREDYDALGGMRELYQTHYQDVDFCLRLRKLGRRILCTPRTRLIHHESATRGSDYDVLDRALFLDSWGEAIGTGDPYSRWEPAARIGVCGA